MERRNNKRYILAMGVMIYLVLCLCIFMLNHTYNGIFWISFGFMTLAYLSCGAILFAKAGTNVQEYYLNQELYHLLLIYLIIETAAALFFIGVNVGFFSPVWVFLIQMILFAAFAVLNFLLAIRRNETNAVIGVKERKRFIEISARQLEETASFCGEPGLQKELIRLAEDLHYSVPSADEEIRKTEEEIKWYIERINKSVRERNYENAANDTEQLKLLISRRNSTVR